MDYGKLLQAGREGFQAYGKNRAVEKHCKYKAGTKEWDAWWDGFMLAQEICQAVLLEKKDE